MKFRYMVLFAISSGVSFYGHCSTPEQLQQEIIDETRTLIVRSINIERNKARTVGKVDTSTVYGDLIDPIKFRSVLHKVYGVPSDCGVSDSLAAMLTLMLRAQFAATPEQQKAELQNASKSLDNAGVWLKSAARDYAFCRKVQLEPLSQELITDFIPPLSNAGDVALAEQRRLAQEAQARVAAEQARKDEEARKLAQKEATRKQRIAELEQRCISEFGIPPKMVNVVLKIFNELHSVCEMATAANISGAKFKYEGKFLGGKHQFFYTRGANSFKILAQDYESQGLRGLALFPVSYELNGEKTSIQSEREMFQLRTILAGF